MKLLFKNAFLKVRKSFGRFLSLLLIVALGLGFFAGLRETAPDMLYTANHYYQESKLMDAKIVSTMGLDESDVTELKELSDLSQVVPSYSKEILANKEVVTVHSLEETINQVTLTKGRMPKNNDECLGEDGHYKIGQIVEFDASEQENFKKTTCKIVGTVTSPIYIATEKGISNSGNGKITSFLYLPKDNFNLSYYTEIYLRMKDTDQYDSYKEDYKNYYKKVEKKIEKIKTKQEKKRYDSLQNEFIEQKNKLETELAKIESQLTMVPSTSSNAMILNQTKLQLEQSLQTLQEQSSNLTKPTWYIFDRTNINGYTSFEEDALKVSSIASIFPIFFILVAAFMCFNTMTRMIEEERTEIGILSALGYTSRKIISSYLYYVFIATVTGIAIGFLIGYNLIPRVIYDIYAANYVLPELIIVVNKLAFVSMITITLFLILTVTILACMKELKCKPAILLRPKSPKSGKKVLLEFIPMIWNRFSFIWKVTIRNMFRYKKRIFMTVLGVAGCTALLLTGLGLKDGIASIGKIQYQELIRYDALLVLQNQNETITNEHIKDSISLSQTLSTFKTKGKTHDATIIVPKEKDKLNQYIVLRDSKTKEKLTLPNDGVLITEKIAELLKVDIGDHISIELNDHKKVSLLIKGIVENYALHYIYMSEEVYQTYIDSNLNYQTLAIKLDQEEEDVIAEELYKNSSVQSIFFTSDNMETFDIMIDGLNQIIYLIVGAASLLALVVLYNLTAININERLREIATLKVLGFKDKEVSNYIDRETMMLTLIGICVGLFLGVILHHYVILTAEMDNMKFIREIVPSSYALAFVMTLLFSIIIEFFTYFRLKKVDMIDSLKSVE